MAGWFSFTSILTVIFIAYISHSVWSIYQIFYPKPCPHGEDCISAYLEDNPKLLLEVYTSQKERIQHESQMKLLWRNDSIKITDRFDIPLEVELPLKTRRNGTLYVHVFLRPRNEEFDSPRTTYINAELTRYSKKRAATFNLMSGAANMSAGKPVKVDPVDDQPVTHWKSHLYVSVMDEKLALFRRQAPPTLVRYIRLSPEGSYLPIVYIDDICTRDKDLMLVNNSVKTMPLTLHYAPISVGKLMMWTQISDSFKMMYSLGFSEKDTDEVKGIFADTNFFLLIVTFVVAAFHLLFDFLAFKNDVSFWQTREDMVGLSTRMVLWRCTSTIIVFFYLMDENTSLLILIPAGVGTIIEIWKVKKAFKVKVTWASWRPNFDFGMISDKERETEQFDSEAMKYLSYVLYPLCIAGAVYSLLYVPFKSWYSWCINSLVNGVYAFGFLFMLPQLFLNYKLKSVAHLPWRTFMYKAFNTFIDDVFAFIITMPTAHRLACFRDDLVFMIYLYQRWLYPVDKKRANEYGQSFDEKSAPVQETKKSK